MRLYLVRHGQPDYSRVPDYGFWGFGRDFAPLSPEGVAQAERTAGDPRLREAELILSSPYTRALQTAQILSRRTGLSVAVELGLHEWMPDRTNRFATPEEAASAAEAFTACRGVYPSGEERPWETLEHMRRRVREVLDRYAEYGTLVVVGHGMALRTLAYIEDMAPGEIVACAYTPGQADCVYSFR